MLHPGFDINKKNQCDGDKFEIYLSFRLWRPKLCSSITEIFHLGFSFHVKVLILLTIFIDFSFTDQPPDYDQLLHLDPPTYWEALQFQTEFEEGENNGDRQTAV